MAQLTNSLVLDLIRIMGVRSAKKAILFPLATGGSIMMSLLMLKSQRKEAKYVLWSRIDQKSCFKAILSANLIPVIIDTIQEEDQVITNVAEFESQIQKLGATAIVCLISTTSCFAPRACDNIEAISGLAKKFNIPHIVNNAYGLQSTWILHQIEQSQRLV